MSKRKLSPQSSCLPDPWQIVGSVAFKPPMELPDYVDVKKNVLPKVAAFDMDGTLAATKSGNIMPVDEHDYVMLPNVKTTLQRLRDEGYMLIIFTNQLDCIENNTVATLATKIGLIQKEIGDDFQFDAVYMAGAKDFMRKPCRGMYDFFLDHIHHLLHSKFPNDDITDVINATESFYVGDAAGRDGLTPTQAKKSKQINPQIKDHSGADYGFALNIGLKFLVPEVIFQGRNAKDYTLDTKGTHPHHIINHTGYDSNSKYTLDYICQELYTILTNTGSTRRVCILMNAAPASGKTTLTKALMKYIDDKSSSSSPLRVTWINQDTLTKPKCLSTAEITLGSNDIRHVIIDNTNSKKDQRKPYIDLAKKANAYIVSVSLYASPDLSTHLNHTRSCTTLSLVAPLPSVAFNMYWSKKEDPTAAEGIDHIMKIPQFLASPEILAVKTSPDNILTPRHGVHSHKAALEIMKAPCPEHKSPVFWAVLGPVSRLRTPVDYFMQVYAAK